MSASILTAVGSGGIVGFMLGLLGGGVHSGDSAPPVRGRRNPAACRNRNRRSCGLGECLCELRQPRH